MTENKRFTWNSKDVLIDDNVTGNQLEVIDITEIDVLLEVLNNLHEENTHLQNDNLKAFALLGDIRALSRGLLQQDNLDTIIEKIDKFEKEILND